MAAASGSKTSPSPGIENNHLPLIQPVNFDQGDADRVVLAAHDGGVISWRECAQDSGFVVVGRREASRLDLRLLCIFPVVVRGDERAISIMQLQDRILQRVGDTMLG